MLTIKVDRKWKREGYTISNFVLFENGKEVFRTNCIEDKDRGLKSFMPLDEIRKKKVYGKTAIPSGTYNVILTYSQKFGARTSYGWCKGILPEIENVKGFSGVRIHAGNSAEDSLGCLLVGKNDKVGWVSDSMNTLKKVYPFIKKTLDNKEKVQLVIE